MPCYACSKSYGFFCKEAGCPNCGFSFCTKCLKRTIEVPKCGNAIKNVCLSCYEKLLTLQKNNEQSFAQYSSQATASSSSKSKKKEVLNVLDEPIPADQNLPDVDNEIKKRLEVLKKPNEPVNDLASNRDIGERLANLKDMPYKEHDHTKLINAVDKRTEQEKTNDLVEQFMNEASIDGAMAKRQEDDIDDIHRRLAALKGSNFPPTDRKLSTDNNDEVEDEETFVKKIVTKYMDEATLPDSDLTPEEKEFVNSVKPNAETEELPWCTVCNEDATIRCVGCDGDLFCRQCFKEIHDDEEYRQHQTKSYVAKKESIES